MAISEQELKDAYDKGYVDGLRAYAWWNDGVQYVGSFGRTLDWAVKRRTNEWNYKPPEPLEK